MMVSGSMELLNRRRNCIISASDQTGHSAIEQTIIDFDQNRYNVPVTYRTYQSMESVIMVLMMMAGSPTMLSGWVGSKLKTALKPLVNWPSPYCPYIHKSLKNWV